LAVFSSSFGKFRCAATVLGIAFLLWRNGFQVGRSFVQVVAGFVVLQRF